MDERDTAEQGARQGVLPPVFPRVQGQALKPRVLLPVPLVRKARDYTCGVACVAAVLLYAARGFDTREDILAGLLKAGPDDGTAADNMVDFLNHARYADEPRGRIRAELRRNMTAQELKKRIDAGQPCICLLQAWKRDAAGRPVPGYDYTDEWDCGHYAIAAGCDGARFYFMDPIVGGNYTTVPAGALDARWHDIDAAGGVCEHAAIVISVAAPGDGAGEFCEMP